MKTKRVLAVHDLCSFGRCSLTAAIPVISAMGMQVCPFPTALFSNNLTYGEFTFHDFTDKMTGFMDRWEKLGFQYDAVYSGFLASVEQIEVVRDAVKRFASKEGALVVVDPAMGDDGKLYPVFGPEYVEAMRTLVKEATLITPNTEEAALLSGIAIHSEPDMYRAGEVLLGMGCRAVLIKGGHLMQQAMNDILFTSGNAPLLFSAEKVDTPNTHGTGCTLSSAIASYLALGKELKTAIALAKQYVHEGLTAGAHVTVGHGHGPLNHLFAPLPLLAKNNTK